MSLEYQKKQYEEKMALIEAKYKGLAKKFFHKGLKAFNDAIRQQELPNWNDFFDDLWEKFTNLTLRCPDCHHIKNFGLDFQGSLDIGEEFNKYINIICPTCKRLVDLNRWIIV